MWRVSFKMIQYSFSRKWESLQMHSITLQRSKQFWLTMSVVLNGHVHLKDKAFLEVLRILCKYVRSIPAKKVSVLQKRRFSPKRCSVFWHKCSLLRNSSFQITHHWFQKIEAYTGFRKHRNNVKKVGFVQFTQCLLQTSLLSTRWN